MCLDKEFQSPGALTPLTALVRTERTSVWLEGRRLAAAGLLPSGRRRHCHCTPVRAPQDLTEPLAQG